MLVPKGLDHHLHNVGSRGVFRSGFGWSLTETQHTALNVCLFPPLFFFFALYYTDVLAVLLVLVAYRAYMLRSRNAVAAIGFLALLSRQTNIFWVAVFLGGLQLCRTLPRGRLGVGFPENPTVADVVLGGWRYGCLYDPLVSQACLEGSPPSSVQASPVMFFSPRSLLSA